MDKREFPDYSQIVPFEMNFEKIMCRLENNFYHTKEHLLMDCQLIEKNCQKFNTIESPIAQNSSKFVEILI